MRDTFTAAVELLDSLPTGTLLSGGTEGQTHLFVPLASGEFADLQVLSVTHIPSPALLEVSS